LAGGLKNSSPEAIVIESVFKREIAFQQEFLGLEDK